MRTIYTGSWAATVWSRPCASREACLRRGLPLHFDSRTNQQFPILTREQQAHLEKKYAFTLWEPLNDGRAVVRFCASWATDPAAVDALTADLLSLP